MTHLVLVVEDEPVQRQIVRRMLENELRVEVVEATDGAEALHMLRTPGHNISLALIDLHLPALSGMGLLRALREDGAPMATIMLTASERIEDVTEAMQLGALDFIPKPMQRERLMASVKNALTIHDLTAQIRAAVKLLDGDGRAKTLAQIEEEVIAHAFSRCGGHVGRAAQLLGMGQSTLYKRRKSA